MRRYQERPPLMYAWPAQLGNCRAVIDLFAVCALGCGFLKFCYICALILLQIFDKQCYLFAGGCELTKFYSFKQGTVRQANMVSTTPFALNALPGAYVLRTFLLDDVLK